jgi:serine/threonine protein kinase
MVVMRMPGPEHIKAYMKMILEGVGFLHKNWVLHRYVDGLVFGLFAPD